MQRKGKRGERRADRKILHSKTTKKIKKLLRNALFTRNNSLIYELIFQIIATFVFVPGKK